MMHIKFPKNRNVVFAITAIALTILFALSGTGYAEDLSDQIPEYTAATGFGKYIGYLMVFLSLLYSCRQAWKMWKERKG